MPRTKPKPTGISLLVTTAHMSAHNCPQLRYTIQCTTVPPYTPDTHHSDKRGIDICTRSTFVRALYAFTPSSMARSMSSIRFSVAPRITIVAIGLLLLSAQKYNQQQLYQHMHQCLFCYTNNWWGYHIT